MMGKQIEMRYRDKTGKQIEICYRDKASNDAIVAWDAGMSKEDVETMLREHPTYYRSCEEVAS